MAYEGFSYWQDWENYLGVEDESGLAKYMKCGTLLLESATGHHEKVLGHYRDVWASSTRSGRRPALEAHAVFDPHAF